MPEEHICCRLGFRLCYTSYVSQALFCILLYLRLNIIELAQSSTVHSLMAHLTRRFPFLHWSNWKLYFPSYKSAFLHPDERLDEIGAHDLSTIYLRFRLPGGASQEFLSEQSVLSTQICIINGLSAGVLPEHIAKYKRDALDGMGGPNFYDNYPEYMQTDDWYSDEALRLWLTHWDIPYPHPDTQKGALHGPNTSREGSSSSRPILVDDDSDQESSTVSVKISDRKNVNKIVSIDDAPEFWPVPTPGKPTIAYLLDFRGNQFDSIFDEHKTIDAYIKKQVSLDIFV